MPQTSGQASRTATPASLCAVRARARLHCNSSDDKRRFWQQRPSRAARAGESADGALATRPVQQLHPPHRSLHAAPLSAPFGRGLDVLRVVGRNAASRGRHTAVQYAACAAYALRRAFDAASFVALCSRVVAALRRFAASCRSAFNRRWSTLYADSLPACGLENWAFSRRRRRVRRGRLCCRQARTGMELPFVLGSPALTRSATATTLSAQSTG